jgi:hypothetical protein
MEVDTPADTHMVDTTATAASTAAAAAPSASPVPATPAAASSSVLPASRSLLYSLMIRQLLDDGLTDLASSLSSQTGIGIDPSFPRFQLATLVDSALAALTVQEGADRARMELGRAEDAPEEAEATEEEEGKDEATNLSGTYSHLGAPSALLDLTAHTRISKLSTPFPAYSSRFGFSHTDAVTCATFSSDGAFAATGSRDSSIKLLDVARMRAAPALETTSGRIHKKPVHGVHPLIRTYFDHESAISELAFHPFEPFLLSGSRDATLKLFGYAAALSGTAEEGSASVAVGRKCTKVLALENAPVSSISFHPSGQSLAQIIPPSCPCTCARCLADDSIYWL